MNRIDAILLRQDYLPQPITTANPVTDAPQSTPKAGHPRGCCLSDSFHNLSADIGILTPVRLTDQSLIRQQSLHRAVERGAVVFAVCAGLQIIGETFADAEGGPVPGLGLLDCRTIKTDEPDGNRRILYLRNIEVDGPYDPPKQKLPDTHLRIMAHAADVPPRPSTGPLAGLDDAIGAATARLASPTVQPDANGPATVAYPSAPLIVPAEPPPPSAPGPWADDDVAELW